MRIRITLTVDEEAWKEIYGPNRNVRRDVLDYLYAFILDAPAVTEGLIENVTIE